MHRTTMSFLSMSNIYHNLASATLQVAHSLPTVHSLASSIHAVLRLPWKHFL